MQYQGKSEQESEQMAAMSAKGSVQVQATLSAVKEMSGWTFYGCMACAVIFLAVSLEEKKTGAVCCYSILKRSYDVTAGLFVS